MIRRKKEKYFHVDKNTFYWNAVCGRRGPFSNLVTVREMYEKKGKHVFNGPYAHRQEQKNVIFEILNS